MEKEEIVSLMNNIELENAQAKINYWKAVGTAMLDESLGEKWCNFVEKHANDDYTRGVFLDEMLQIISMIKANIPYETIAQVLSQIPDEKSIVHNYLGAFIHPEILEEIQSKVDSMKR